MSTIGLTHEGNISIEHLASMSTTALVVDMIVTAKRSARVENAKRDHRRCERAIHRGGACKEPWCCPKGTKPQRPTNHELKLVALWDDFEPHMEDGAIYAAAGADSLAASDGGWEFYSDNGYHLTTEWVPNEPVISRWEAEAHVDNIVAKQRAEQYWVEQAAERAKREAAKQRKHQEFLERQRSHWSKVYQRPEAEQAAKRSLTDHAVLSTATK